MPATYPGPYPPGRKALWYSKLMKQLVAFVPFAHGYGRLGPVVGGNRGRGVFEPQRQSKAEATLVPKGVILAIDCI